MLHCYSQDILFFTFFTQTGELDDRTLSIFNSINTRLERVNLKDSKNLSQKGLNIFNQHAISDLEASNLKVGDLVNSLSDWSLVNLVNLRVANCTFLDPSSKVVVMASLSKLKNLRSLDVSYTDFNNHGLEVIIACKLLYICYFIVLLICYYFFND